MLALLYHLHPQKTGVKVQGPLHVADPQHGVQNAERAWIGKRTPRPVPAFILVKIGAQGFIDGFVRVLSRCIDSHRGHHLLGSFTDTNHQQRLTIAQHALYGFPSILAVLGVIFDFAPLQEARFGSGDIENQKSIGLTEMFGDRTTLSSRDGDADAWTGHWRIVTGMER